VETKKNIRMRGKGIKPSPLPTKMFRSIKMLELLNILRVSIDMEKRLLNHGTQEC